MFVIPLEMNRLEKLKGLSEEHLDVKQSFIMHQTRCLEEANKQTEGIKLEIVQL